MPKKEILIQKKKNVVSGVSWDWKSWCRVSPNAWQMHCKNMFTSSPMEFLIFQKNEEGDEGGLFGGIYN